MKTGDKVIVPAEINGYGRDLRAIVTEIEKFAGAIFVTVIFTEPCPEACGRGGGVYHDFQDLTGRVVPHVTAAYWARTTEPMVPTPSFSILLTATFYSTLLPDQSA